MKRRDLERHLKKHRARLGDPGAARITETLDSMPGETSTRRFGFLFARGLSKVRPLRTGSG